jgi:hypothetical protein
VLALGKANAVAFMANGAALWGAAETEEDRKGHRKEEDQSTTG